MTREPKRPLSRSKWTGQQDDVPFLEAITAAPDDDGPRVVFADHLIERCDPPRGCLRAG
ncbi:MAG: TIGR02996 domain-containing protein [Labilithrix sp.]|nr:TIGR02996 domain-containing protein [Labilithrix sp.]MCW5812458.1 TIGR02996 domain-containing protein [Labilithrix sp.]